MSLLFDLSHALQLEGLTMGSRRDFLVQTAGIALGSAAAAGCGKAKTRTDEATRAAAARDTFDLEVTVTGLSLFLPNKDKGKMHVLMVAPVIDPGEGQDRAEPHYPRVFYDAAYDSQVEAGQYWRAVPLESSVLDLSGFQSQNPQTPQIPDIPDITGLVDLRDYGTLGDPEGTRPANLACRLTLPRGSWETPERSKPWEIQSPAGQNKPAGKDGEAAWHVVWTVPNIKGPMLEWKLTKLNPAHPVERLTPLRPGADGKIRLLISNVMRKESTNSLQDAPAPNPGTPMPHFRAFRDLYGRPAAWPKLIYKGPAADPTGTPYSCLPSGGK